jgi:hypothetical protein
MASRMTALSLSSYRSGRRRRDGFPFSVHPIRSIDKGLRDIATPPHFLASPLAGFFDSSSVRDLRLAHSRSKVSMGGRFLAVIAWRFCWSIYECLHMSLRLQGYARGREQVGRRGLRLRRALLLTCWRCSELFRRYLNKPKAELKRSRVGKGSLTWQRHRLLPLLLQTMH